MSPEERLELKGKLRRAREDTERTGKKVSLREAGEACGGLTPQAVSAWEDQNKVTVPGLEDLVSLAALYRVPLSYFISSVDIGSLSDSLDPIISPGRMVPSVDWDDVSAFHTDRSVAKGRIRTHFNCGPNSFRTFVKNAENAPRLLRGDSIVVDPDARPEPGDLVLAWNADRLAIGRYRPRDERTMIAPVNDDWPTFYARENKIVGVITEHSRQRQTGSDNT